jgi:hypothetical protein
MYRRGMFHLCGLAAGALMALMSGAIAQVQQESAKDLIGGTWTLAITWAGPPRCRSLLPPISRAPR